LPESPGSCSPSTLGLATRSGRLSGLLLMFILLKRGLTALGEKRAMLVRA
jgi:hypothetical protein